MRFGIDLGGSKIEIQGFDGLTPIYHKRVATPQGSYTKTLESIVTLVHQAEIKLGQKGSVGIAIPGTVERESGLVKNANSTCLIGKPLIKELSTLLDREVRFANDADCLTLSEATDGAAADYNLVFGVILGTGVGGGICFHHNLLQGANQICGEWGHNPMPWADHEPNISSNCYCGKKSCIETYLSGPGFTQMSHQRFPSLQEFDSSEKIWRAYQVGHSDALEAANLYFEQLAKALSSVINLLDPDIIVVGGGLSKVTALYSEIPKRWRHYIFSNSVHTRIVPAKFGDTSGIRGAAWLWPEKP